MLKKNHSILKEYDEFSDTNKPVGSTYPLPTIQFNPDDTFFEVAELDSGEGDEVAVGDAVSEKGLNVPNVLEPVGIEVESESSESFSCEEHLPTLDELSSGIMFVCCAVKLIFFWNSLFYSL